MKIVAARVCGRAGGEGGREGGRWWERSKISGDAEPGRAFAGITRGGEDECEAGSDAGDADAEGDGADAGERLAAVGGLFALFRAGLSVGTLAVHGRFSVEHEDAGDGADEEPGDADAPGDVAERALRA